MSVVIVPYQPKWPAVFQTIGTALRHALGDTARRIDHIGSTAVPGLAAKDRIDVQIAVENLSTVDTLRSRIEALGYEARPQITHDHVPADLIDNVAEWRSDSLPAVRTLARPTSMCAGWERLTSATRCCFGTISVPTRPAQPPAVN
jgi:GrpB-like predicted nucleotidyltransferase (UPF0157 family)